MHFQLFKNREYQVCRYRVIDGDTVYIRVVEEPYPKREHRVRLYGIDAPEYDQSMDCAKSSWGKLKRLCDRAKFLTIRITDEKDKYGRSVGILYGHCRDWKKPLDINQTIVLDGYAKAYKYNGRDPYREEDHLAKLESRGIRQQIDKIEPPWEYRENQKYQPKAPFNWRRFRKSQRRNK